jgi:hypothetical protein
MSCKAAYALLSAIAAPAITFLMVISTGPAGAAAACNAAPKSPPPQGSHWYYRTDRSLDRKCWYLASAGQKTQEVAPQTAARARATAAPETDPTAADETPAKQLTRPARLMPQEAMATPTGQATPPQAEPALQTPLPRASAAEQADVAPSVPATQTAANEAAFRLLEERRAQLPASPPPAVSASVAEADSSPISLFQILLISFMAACLLASVVPHMLRARRRRREARIVDLNVQSPLRTRAATQGAAAARRAPPADDVEIDDERLRAFERGWRQHAAA